jgi:hypothetical protein
LTFEELVALADGCVLIKLPPFDEPDIKLVFAFELPMARLGTKLAD